MKSARHEWIYLDARGGLQLCVALGAGQWGAAGVAAFNHRSSCDMTVGWSCTRVEGLCHYYKTCEKAWTAAGRCYSLGQ